MVLVQARIIKNRKLRNGFFLCSFKVPRIARRAQPGQFVNIKVSQGTDPLLRRPFSIFRATHERIDVMYEVVGKGTAVLSGRGPGECVDMLGPLGSGFSYHGARGRAEEVFFVAGGMGVAPLVFLAGRVKAARKRFLIGAKTKKALLGKEKTLYLRGCQVYNATDDGSKGFHGRVTQLLERMIERNCSVPMRIYACGPKPMLQEVSRISGAYAIPAQLSLEEHMACGFGACLGCVIKTRQGYRRVCKEGPVFRAEDIIWGEQTDKKPAP